MQIGFIHQWNDCHTNLGFEPTTFCTEGSCLMPYSTEPYTCQPSGNVRGFKMKLMQKCQKLQFVKCPLESISIHLHVKIANFTAEINMFTGTKNCFGLYIYVNPS